MSEDQDNVTPEDTQDTPVEDVEATVEPDTDADFDIDVPDDIPLPEEREDTTIKDDFDGAFNFAFVGAGQGGSRIVEAFYSMGYKRACVINTASQDLAAIKLPEANKLQFGDDGGAGKVPSVATQRYKEQKEDVLDLMRRSFGPDVDRVFVCVGSGGGTGCGTALPLVDTAEEFMESIRAPERNVGVIAALPKNSEGKAVNKNSAELLANMLRLASENKISPLIIIDNERISSIYPGLAAGPFWTTANKSIASLFHLFNTTSVKVSPFTSFDKADYKTLLDSGVLLFGAAPVKDWMSETAVSKAVRDNLKRNMLCGGFDLETGSIAGAIVIGGAGVLNEVPQENLDHAFEQLSRILKKGNTVHRGIYRGKKDNLVVYTMVGGLAAPKDRLLELKRLS